MPQNSEEVIEQRLMLVSRRYLQGVPQFKIAEEVGVNPSQISRDLDTLRERWRMVNLANISEIILEQLNKLDLMEVELWEAWDRSKREFREKRTKGTGLKKLSKDGGEYGGNEILGISEVTDVTKEKEPNVGYMSALLQLMERRAKLIGLDAGLNLNENIVVTIKA